MLYLTKEQIGELVDHSRRGYPSEACGILAGKNELVVKIYQTTNKDNSASTFFMDPKEQLKVMKEIRNSSLEMVGIYHSHPETQAYPSAHDVELAYYPDVSYVIVSLKEKDNPVVKAFKIKDGKITEEEIGTK